MKNSNNKELHIDLETYSEIDIVDCGSYRYIDDESFEILLVAFAFNNDPVEIVDICQGEVLPEMVVQALADPTIIKKAHNANFERNCLKKYLKTEMPPEQWVCSAVRASELGLPRSLEAVGEALGLEEDQKKLKTGKALIQYFCKPCKPTKANGGRIRNMPWHYIERWELFKEYCKQDVATERVIDKRLEAYPETKPMERALWCLDQRINDYGVLVDLTLAQNILNYNDYHIEALMNEAKTISGLDNPQSLSQAKAWIKSLGYSDLTSLTKNDIKIILKEINEGWDKLPPEETNKLKRFLEIRQELGKTSVTKYAAITRSVCHDGRVRGMLLFYGANRTGRWAGRIVQLQNLPQNKLDKIDFTRNLVLNDDFDLIEMFYKSPMDVFSQLIRTSFIARDGYTFAVADYSAIEARVIAWLAGEKWVQEVFATHGKIYEATAAQMFHVPIESVTHGSDLRKKGKIAQLACGYQGGVGALSAMDSNNDIPEEEKQSLIDSWRAANPHIVKFWYDTEANAKNAIRYPGTIVRGPHGIAFKMIKDTLFIRLPSGRSIAYNKAVLAKTGNGRESITYMGTNQETKRWERTETYGGKIVENIVQATARDCLGNAMLNLSAKGYNAQFHIHDEVIIEVEESRQAEALEEIRNIMRLKDVEWIKGLILNAEGYTTKYYMKD